MNNATIDQKQLKTVLKTAVKNNHQLLIVGSPGTAKTAIFNQSMEELISEGIELLYFPEITSVAESVDYGGIIWVTEDKDGKKMAKKLPLDFVKKLINAKKKTVVFIDDLGQADISVQKALMHLIHDRKLNGDIIPEHVLFIGATNSKTDKAGVNGIIEPLKSRFHCLLYLEPNSDCFIEWALQNKLDERVIGHIAMRPEFLKQAEMTMNMESGSNPRNIHHVSDILQANYPEDVQYQMISGACGRAYADDFIGYCRVYKDLPDITDIRTKPDETMVPENLASKYAVALAIATKTNRDSFKNFLTYAKRLGKQFEFFYIKSTITKCPDVQKTSTFTEWAVENKDFFI